VPFTARDLDQIHAGAGGPPVLVYDVELPYRRLGRCRLSDDAAAMIGTERAQVAVALSIYEARNGKHATAAQLLGPGVDLGFEDVPQAVGRR
jgi:hypothetical protein